MQTQKHERMVTRVQHWLISRRPPPATTRLSGMVQGALSGVAAYVLTLTPLLFSVNPLPLALLCGAERGIGWILAGITLALWQTGGPGAPWYWIAALCILPLRRIGRLYLTPERPHDAQEPRELRQLFWRCRIEQLRALCFRGGSTPSAPSAALPTLPPLFDEPFSLRVAASLLASLIPAIALPVIGDFAYYDLYGAIFMLLLTPLATALFAAALSTFFPATPAPRPRQGQLAPLLGVALLLFAVCFCGRSLRLLGLSPVILLAVFLTLLAAREYGLGAGVAVGLLCGLAYDPLTVPLLLCLGVLYALLRPLIGRFSLLPATMAALLYLLLCGNDLAFAALTPSLVVGVLLSGALEQWQQRAAAVPPSSGIQYIDAEDPGARAYTQQARHRALIARMSAISGAFGTLAEVVRQLDDPRRSRSGEEWRALCEQTLDGYCPDCPHYERCHKEEAIETLTMLCALQEALIGEGRVGEQQLGDSLRRRCPHKRSWLGEINERATRMLSYESLYPGAGEQFSSECEEIARLLRDLVRSDGGLDRAADPLSKKETAARCDRVRSYLDRRGIPTRAVFWESATPARLHLIGLDPVALPLPPERLRVELSEVLACPLGDALSERNEEDEQRFIFPVGPTWRADYVHRSVAVSGSLGTAEGANGKSVRSKKPSPGLCGDALRVFEGEGGLFYALLCDGMGKGPAAAMTSGLCGVFLERVLRAGVEVPTALRMLNHYLRARVRGPEQEISCTVDLFVLDLFSGQGQFVKCGAAPSVVVRQERLFRLDSHSFPIGILQATDVRIIPFEVKEGDHILLMSDGVTDAAAEGEAEWLCELLTGREAPGAPAHPDRMAPPPSADDSTLIARIFAKARQLGSADDMSVISIRIGRESS